MTCDELVEIARAGRADVRYARNKTGTLIGAWIEEMGRYYVVAALSLTGSWIGMPFEVLANGQPMHKPEDWI